MGSSSTSSAEGFTSDAATQTEVTKHLLSTKIDAMLLRNEVTLMKTDMNTGLKVVSSISHEAVGRDSALMKHFVGLSSEQFEALHNFLNSVCPLDKISFWNGKGKVFGLKSNGESQFTTRECLFIYLLRLKRGFMIKTMAILLSSCDRLVKEHLIRKFFTTCIQLMYKIFRDMEHVKCSQLMISWEIIYQRF